MVVTYDVEVCGPQQPMRPISSNIIGSSTSLTYVDIRSKSTLMSLSLMMDHL